MDKTIKKLVSLKRQAEALDQEMAQLRASLEAYMLDAGLDKIDSKIASITLRAAGFNNVLDTAKIKQDYQDVYEACLKQQYHKASVLVKIK